MDSIFKTYDILGRYPDEVNEDLAFSIGKAVVKFLNANQLVVGHDARQGSESMAKKLIEGITSVGCDVIEIGPATTPLFYFSVNTTKAQGGVMITASHNPKEYNGFKIVGPGAEAAPVSEIEKLIKHNSSSVEKIGTVRKQEFIDDYVNFMLEETQAEARDMGKMKIVVDSSNGMTGLVLKNLFKKINVNAFPIFQDVNGAFPNHSPDTSRAESLLDLQNKVREMEADFGVAFDGDGDRLALVDNTGQIVWPDHILGLLFQAMGYPKTVYDIRISRGIKKLLGERGIPSRVGYPFIREAMREYGADLGGELSGHFFFRETHYCESAIMAMLKLIVVLSQTKEPLSKIVEPLRAGYLHTGEIKIDLNGRDPKPILEEIKKRYASGRLNEIDGVMVEYDDWWFDLRPSHTEPVLRLVIEAESQSLLAEKRNELLSQLT